MPMPQDQAMAAPAEAAAPPAAEQKGGEVAQLLAAGHELLALLPQVLAAANADPALADQAKSILSDYDSLAKAVAQGGNAPAEEAEEPSEEPARSAPEMSPMMTGGAKNVRQLL